MVRRFSWCTLVALVVLLFVTTDGLREHSTQIDDHKATNRGTLRFNSKSLEEATTVSPSPLSRSKTKWDRSAQSETLSNFERTIQASVINSEPKFDTSEHSTVRTIRTTERGSVSTATDVTSEWRRTSGKRFEETKRVEPTINRRDGKRYFSESNKGTKLKNNEQKFETSKGISRRTSNGRANNSTVTERLDNKGPSVFLATTESSRSRTGRKIQTTYSMKDLKTQIPTSRRYNSKKFRDVETTTASFRRESRGRSTTEKIERSTRSGRSKVNNAENNSIARRGPDPLLSESESVRVDIPLTVDETGNPASDVTTGFDVASQRRSDAKESSRSSRTGFERSKSRGRSNDSEASGSSRSASPRGSSKFSDSTTTEANEQVVSSRRNTVSRDRSRGSEIKKNSVNESRSRSRGRNVENNMKPISGGASERNVKRKVAGERNSSDRRSRIPDVTPRATDSRRQDTQDMRGRSRSKSRSDVTTPITMDVTTTVAPDTTVFTDVTATDSEITSTTIRLATTPSPRATSRPLSTSASTLEASGRGRGRGRSGSHGRKQKEDFFNHGLGFRGRKPSPEGSANVTESRKTVSWKNDSQSHGNPGWTLRRRPAHFNSENISKTIVSSPRDQTNEVVPSNEQSTSTETITTIESSTFGTKRGLKKLQTTDESSTVVETTTKSYRRGNKTFGNGKVIAALEESDNYPPEFKARLTQLKNTNTKIPASKTTSRTPLEVKKSSAALFAERSRMKLELARRLVKPELNIEENDLDATTASSFSKRKPTGVPVVDETSKVAKYSKPAAAAPGRNRPSTSVESTQEEVSVKTLKLPSSRKAHDDSSKVTGRPYSLKKGRVIAERMVTSISIEERAIAEETTRPYALTTNPSMITSAEQGSATTIDSTRVRLASDRGGKKSKEEDSTPTKNMKVSLYSTQRVETTDLVTTIKPKKSYSYQSRNKLREQSATIDQSFTTSTPKKSYSSTQSKSQTSQEENITKKSKFATSATKPIFRPRYSKRTNEKSFEKKTTDEQATFTTKLPVATSRYSKKKSSVKSIDDKSATTEGLSAQTRKIEFRPRTATYRRHSEIPTTLTESSTKVDGVGIAITPRSTKYHATLKTSTVSPRSVAQGPQVNLKIANETAQETPGITGSSNGDSGNSNVFNPTRSTFLSGNSTLLEQLRSTVAPLLSSLGNKTPVFSGSYSNVNNVNSPPRVTPSGQPPRFSARYKGAELFVRKQNNIYQPTVPSITSSSTTPITPVESNALLNTQMRTASVTPIVSTGRPPTDSQGGRIVQDRERDEATRTKEAGGQRSSVYIGQDKFVNYWTDGASTSNPRVLSVNINSVATAANEGSSPSVPSFENLLNNQPGGRVTAPPGFPWRDPLDQIFGITTSSPIITASVSSNRLDDLSEPNGPALARPINPFVEVFTPFSNTIGVPRGNIGSIPPPPPPTTPVAFTTTPTTPAPTTTTTTTSTTMAPTTTTTTTTVAPTTTTMMTPITTTTTMAPTTTTTMMTPTTTTTTMAPTTTTTTMAPTTTTIRAPTVTITTTTSTTMTPTTVAAMTPTTTTMAAPIITSEPPTIVQRVMIASQAGATSETTTSSQINSLNLPKNLLNTRQQNAFGTTFDDLAFLNSLLQSNSRSTSQKTLTQVEQLLANKILELALKNPGPTRSPKAISIENASPNSIYKSATTSRSEPIIIDLSPASTVSTSTRKSVETRQPTSQRPVISSLTPVQVTWKPVTTTSTRRSVEISTASPSTTAKTTLISTTKAPVTVKAKLATTPRPRTTTQAPLGFGGLLWQALLGGGLFGSSTTPKPVKAKLVPKTTQKSVNIMPKPIQTTQKLETTTISSSATLKTVDISKIQVNSPYSIVQEKSVTTPFTISTTDKPLINNPNPRLPGVVTSTYSPEEDAKFIVELLRAVEQDNKTGSKKVSGLTQDDQSFLRAILSGRALTTTTPSPTVEVSNAALLAALLKAQGIEPPTPANNIREQLQLASLGQSVTSAPTASPASESSTITTRPASTAASRPTDTTKKTVTPRPTSGPRIRTTTWSPSSTYPPPLFSSFSNYGTPGQSTGDNSGNSALFGATRAFSQFLGAAISGAAQQLQSLVRNGTRIVSEVVG